MTGLPDNNYPLFNKVAACLRAYGYRVENPAENDIPKDAPWERFMRAAIGKLVLCDILILLPGHEDSDGAMLEKSIAYSLNMPTQFIDPATFLIEEAP